MNCFSFWTVILSLKSENVSNHVSHCNLIRLTMVNVDTDADDRLSSNRWRWSINRRREQCRSQRKRSMCWSNSLSTGKNSRAASFSSQSSLRSSSRTASNRLSQICRTFSSPRTMAVISKTFRLCFILIAQNNCH